MTEALIFDMDGTLWDSAENVAKSWTEKVAEQNDVSKIITTEDIQGVMGLTMDVIADKLFPELPKERRMEVLNACGDYENEYLEKHGGALYPDLESTLEILSTKCDLYIVSNCQCGYIEAFLKYYGFGRFFKDTLCWGQTLVSKGETIKMIMEKNHVSSAYYVGDIQGDCDAARHAGIGFIHASYGFGQVVEPDKIIEKFSDLPEILEKL